MTWVFILLDVLILIALVFLCIIVYLLWTKKKKLNKVSLSNFRNEDIYGKSEEDRKKMAHIEDTLEKQEEDENVPEPVTESEITDSEISFTGGYGGMVELGVENEY